MKRAIELGLLYGLQNGLKGWSWSIAQLDQVVAGQQSRGPNLFRRGLREEPAHQLVVIEVPVAAEAVQPVQFHVLLEVVQPDKALERGGLHLRHVLEAHVVRNERGDLRRFVVRET